MSTFQTHTGTAFRVRRETDFTYQSKEKGKGVGEKRALVCREWSFRNHEQIQMEYMLSLLPPLFIIAEDTGVVEREGESS